MPATVAVGVGSARDVTLADEVGVGESTEPAGGGVQLAITAIAITSNVRFMTRMLGGGP